MKKVTYFTLLFFIVSNTIFSQSIDDSFSEKKMHKDLEVFKAIRLNANSGLYKYRIKQKIDSIYTWADREIDVSSTYRDFYNIICQLTDFEGSLHNNTNFPEKLRQSLKNETSGYFPYPVKWIEGKWILNYEKGEIPLGSEIISINNEKIETIIKNLYKYYTTDGVNITGKAIGINYRFSKYYRFHYGLQDSYKVSFKSKKTNQIQQITLKSIGFIDYYKNFNNRYSKPFDESTYRDFGIGEKYNFKKIDPTTSILTVNSFAIGGNAESPEHHTFVKYLDSVFIKVKESNIKNLIVDIRRNGGGTDPNELVLYEYLTDRNFSENKTAWVSFQKIPFLRYIETKVPSFLRPLGVIKYNKYFKQEFPINKDGKFYQGPLSEDHTIRKPNKNAFTANIYLLISPEVASAGSNFGSLVASNKNTVVIGEESAGGFYGHNGHTPISYILPKSKIKTTFFVVNLEQYVIEKTNQIHNRGIIPDIIVSQSFEDYLDHKDTQMNYVLDLINKNNKK